MRAHVLTKQQALCLIVLFNVQFTIRFLSYSSYNYSLVVAFFLFLSTIQSFLPFFFKSRVNLPKPKNWKVEVTIGQNETVKKTSKKNCSFWKCKFRQGKNNNNNNEKNTTHFVNTSAQIFNYTIQYFVLYLAIFDITGFNFSMSITIAFHNKLIACKLITNKQLHDKKKTFRSCKFSEYFCNFKKSKEKEKIKRKQI